MKSFHLPNKFYYWILAIILIIILHFSGILKPIETYLTKVLNPVAKILQESAYLVSGRQSFKSEDLDLVLELEELRSKQAHDTISLVKLKLLEEENEKLRNQLDFLSHNEYKLVSANIISRSDLFSTETNRQEIIIDKGSLDGLSEGLGVLDENGILVGKIINLKERSAQVCLSVGDDCQIPITILNEDRTMGISRGELGLTIKIDLLPQAEDLSLGDIVISSGLGSQIPHGLVVGKIIEINKQSNEIWQDLSLDPLYSAAKLSLVSIVLP